MQLESLIRDVPNFPKEGIVYKDLTPLLKNPTAMSYTASTIAESVKDKKIDIVAGIESRGFIFAVMVAERLSAGFVPIRKPGKLPSATYSESYQLEYGSDQLEIHQDAIAKGQNVLLVDDLLATGGTMSAGIKLVEACGGTSIQLSFVVELAFLNGRQAFSGQSVESLVKF